MLCKNQKLQRNSDSSGSSVLSGGVILPEGDAVPPRPLASSAFRQEHGGGRPVSADTERPQTPPRGTTPSGHGIGRDVALLSCYWPNATNARGLGAGPQEPENAGEPLGTDPRLASLPARDERTPLASPPRSARTRRNSAPPGHGRSGRAGGVYRFGPPAWYGDTSGGTVPWPRRVSVGGPQAEHSRPGPSDDGQVDFLAAAQTGHVPEAHLSA